MIGRNEFSLASCFRNGVAGHKSPEKHFRATVSLSLTRWKQIKENSSSGSARTAPIKRIDRDKRRLPRLLLFSNRLLPWMWPAIARTAAVRSSPTRVLVFALLSPSHVSSLGNYSHTSTRISSNFTLPFLSFVFSSFLFCFFFSFSFLIAISDKALRGIRYWETTIASEICWDIWVDLRLKKNFWSFVRKERTGILF